MNVPIRNVYQLLLYAWNHLGAGEEASLAAEEPRYLHDLFAQVLADTVSRLISRGLDRGYVEVGDTLAGLRGRMDLGAMLKRGLLGSGRTHCHFDELRHDVPHNRIVKATLRSLLALELDEAVGGRVRRLVRTMNTVADVRVSRRDFSRVQLHRNNRVYDFALRLCRLIHENLMVDPTTGHAAFRDFRADQRRMGTLFEAFVYRFYAREQTYFRVSRPKIKWRDPVGAEPALAMLPEMHTDVVLRSPERRIIVETKFYAEPFSGRYGAKKLRSDHLYQILAYLRNRPRPGPAGPVEEGMLLYPVVKQVFTFDYELNGHHVAVRSIDLDQPWPFIYRDMLALVEDPLPPSSLAVAEAGNGATALS
ncbi:MAG TPA: hypothetical protein VK399_19905 [Longimicrobiaceae bacterium]|nr:hypothetical protein [Longimicrobiaceae bacterium]